MTTTRRTVLAAGLGAAAASEVAPAEAQTRPKTFVLVHGAWHGGWCWRRVADVLERQGQREFIAGLGTAVAWPLVARAQQGDRIRRVGVLMPFDENDPLAKSLYSAFTRALIDLGWTDGRNVRVGWCGRSIESGATGANAHWARAIRLPVVWWQAFHAQRTTRPASPTYSHLVTPKG